MPADGTGTLYLVGTPIGNLGDMSFRAVEILKSVDFIAAEDTRVSRKLCTHFDIRRPLVCYFEHNRGEMGEKILRRLLEGENCALVTDAGMPGISDPGEDLVRRCAEAGVRVTVVPGPSALTAALCLSGLAGQRFTFEGFLSVTEKNRRQRLDSLKDESRTMIFYEAPHKLKRTLEDFLKVFGDRPLALCRELTKLHEEVIRTTVSGALSLYEETVPRGEYVLVVSGAPEVSRSALSETDALSLVRQRQREGLSLKDACREASELSGIPKNRLYAMCLQWRSSGSDS